MSDQVYTSLVSALEIAAFQRSADGTFVPLATVPPWFARLVSDATFPFLGHILEDANQFWESGTAGFQEFGPCAEVDETGHEYHYKVLAVSAAGRPFLLFQRDPAADRLREVLQKAREQALETRDDSRSRSALLLVQKEAAAAAAEIRGLALQLARQPLSPTQIDMLHAIAARCDRLRSCVDTVGLPTAPLE